MGEIMPVTQRIVVLCALVFAIASLGFSRLGLNEVATSSPEGDAVSGREIYVNTCILCHGIDGKGAEAITLVPPPADLSSPSVQNRLDGTLFQRIHEGKPNTAMGAWKHRLSDEEIWDVLAYVRTMKAEINVQP